MKLWTGARRITAMDWSGALFIYGLEQRTLQLWTGAEKIIAMDWNREHFSYGLEQNTLQ